MVFEDWANLINATGGCVESCDLVKECWLLVPIEQKQS